MHRTPHRRPARAADDFVCCGSANTSGHVVPAPSQITSTWSPASLNALAECLALAGEVDRARQVFDRVGARANDVGLLSEQSTPHPGSCSATSRRRSPI